MLIEKRHGFLGDVFVLELGVLEEGVHFILKQVQVIALVLPIAELVEELVDLVPTFFVILDVHVDQGGLHKWHNVAKQLPFLLLDGILVQGVHVGVHELSILVLISL